jgi:hypothetical protein
LRKDWSKEVLNQLIKYNPQQLDFYAGKKYREYLIPQLETKGIKCVIPLEGKGIGEQLKYYKDQLSSKQN